MPSKKQLVVLTILDGWGYSEEEHGNALQQARLPHFQNFWRRWPHTLLDAAGQAVGLPDGQMGNSEVGHLNLGAGRIVDQDFTRISKAITNGSFYKNEALENAIENVARTGGAVHLMGLVSDGGVHSHQEHLYALLEMAKRKGLKKVFIHAFLDGRDVPPASAADYLKLLQERCREIGIGRIATVMGRYYGMDRDQRWDRTERAYQALVEGKGHKAQDAVAAVKRSYNHNITDEFIEPIVITNQDEKPVGTIKDGDTVIFFNFRADRARQLTRSFVDEIFNGFKRSFFPQVYFVAMAEYDATIKIPVAFPPLKLDNGLGEVLARQGLRQLRIAETEKYAHVTFFFNGGKEEPNPGEERVLIPSPHVPTYDLQPEMSAPQVAEEVRQGISQRIYDVIIMNFANPDMVGHTGKMAATVNAVESVDALLGPLVDDIVSQGGVVLLTADHGNAEQMVDEQGGEHTAHTENPVPFILIGGERKKQLRRGSLRDVAPTILDLLLIEKPLEMTGKSLLKLE